MIKAFAIIGVLFTDGTYEIERIPVASIEQCEARKQAAAEIVRDANQGPNLYGVFARCVKITEVDI